MELEKVKAVRLKVTLKEGEEVWLKGEVLNVPLPKAIIGELKAGTGNVEVVSLMKDEPEPVEEIEPKKTESKGRLVV